MPRKYVTPLGIKPRKYNKKAVELAFEAVTSGRMTRKQAVKTFKVAESTLRDKLNGKRAVGSSPGSNPALSPEVEFQISESLSIIAAGGFPVDKKEIPMIVSRYLNENNCIIPRFKNNAPGTDWTNNFLERHHELSVRIKNNIKWCRPLVTDADIDNYFDNITEHLKNIAPTHIFNYDESNLSDDPGLKKILFSRGVKYPVADINFSKSAITIMMCVSASGEMLPPFVNYKAQEMFYSWQKGGPVGDPFCNKRCCIGGSKYAISKTGWFDMTTFEWWFMDLFLPHVKIMDGKKVLIGDNLSSHFTPNVLKKCEEEQILIICLPADSTYLLRPLNVAFYGSLRDAWKTLLLDWKRKNPGQKTLNKNLFPFMLNQIFNHDEMANCKQNILAGFSECGLYPLDRVKVKKKSRMFGREVAGHTSPAMSKSVAVPSIAATAQRTGTDPLRSPITQKRIGHTVNEIPRTSGRGRGGRGAKRGLDGRTIEDSSYWRTGLNIQNIQPNPITRMEVESTSSNQSEIPKFWTPNEVMQEFFDVSINPNFKGETILQSDEEINTENEFFEFYDDSELETSSNQLKLEFIELKEEAIDLEKKISEPTLEGVPESTNNENKSRKGNVLNDNTISELDDPFKEQNDPFKEQNGLNSGQKSKSDKWIKAFCGKRILKNHMHSVHEKFKCSKCNYLFDQKGNLSRHRESVHEKLKPIKCPKCEYSSGL